MSLRKLFLYNSKERVQIILYSLCSRIINSIPRNLKNTYEFTNSLLAKGIHLEKEAQGLFSFPYKINNKVFRFFIKKDSSDSRVFEQIILNEEYKTVVDEIRKRNIKVETILDLGANIGLSSIYLSAYLSPSKIIALEPSKSTFNRLEGNVEHIVNIICIQKGIWSKNSFLKPDLSFRDGQDWSFRLVEDTQKGNEGIEVTTINQLCIDKNISMLDLVKMDIEGGEAEIFKNGKLDWLDRTKVIALEIHDEFECRELIEGILNDKKFELMHSGELTIGFNQELLGESKYINVQ